MHRGTLKAATDMIVNAILLATRMVFIFLFSCLFVFTFLWLFISGLSLFGPIDETAFVAAVASETAFTVTY